MFSNQQKILLLSVYNSRFSQIIRRHLYCHCIACVNANISHPHFATQMSNYPHSVLEEYAKIHVGEQFFNRTFHFDRFFFRHIAFWLGNASYETRYNILKSMTNNHFLDKLSPIMSDSFKKKCLHLKKIFEALSKEKRYELLIQMGRDLPAYPDAYKTPEHLVPGCQSEMHLRSTKKESNLYFEIHSEALISAGLGALLISLYSGETPETILKSSPDFIHEIGINASLSPSRSNGLSNILLAIKKESLKYI